MHRAVEVDTKRRCRKTAKFAFPDDQTLGGSGANFLDAVVIHSFLVEEKVQSEVMVIFLLFFLIYWYLCESNVKRCLCCFY